MMRSSGSGNEKQYLDYENYRHITFKWHFKLTKSLVVLLESKDYMQVHVNDFANNGLFLRSTALLDVATSYNPHYISLPPLLPSSPPFLLHRCVMD